ncbi:hypothetical protein HYPSUDRAFT_581959 [Hypholoma sublateritium FD-334 SS-4]|uniref:Uncharacterized protein n=1 Tax=Hypholoma sublateritium (strain FD-334 SS-4) TaxID=945553 RepID=A0A0D2MIT9_HYPSF|nr:hypothetical protein HYPSUDRAFT_581959 [Hypholoma sublateritium FD-334 SS-4]
MSRISQVIFANKRPIPHLDHIQAYGSADVHLEDGTTKSPDYSYYDPNKPPKDSMLERYRRMYPTIIWEVAFAEDARKLGSDCARWVGASGGNINMAISITIQSLSEPDITEEFSGSITISVWRVHDFIEDEGTNDCECGFLRRTDGHSDEDLASPLADEYLFISNWGGDIVT